ncbi:MAG: monofunctional biosynthetic peptidoglycan transglycosylase [Deltaproteobacteria bacterium]|nr:monofunctional biosynthetic peptidoglycan transglycosylase [Deltaproteobacteria bacterium]
MQRSPLKPYKKKSSFLRRAFIPVLSILLLVFLLQILLPAHEIFLLTVKNPQSTKFIQTYLKGCEHPCFFEQEWVNLDKISKHLQEAVLIGEDDTFFEHDGIDTDALESAWEANLKKKRIVRGGSTITQQLVKNLYLDASKNPLRKIKEIILALWMEKVLEKKRILEIYLNVIEWGKGIYGAQAASHFYFKKDAENLNSEEAAYLAAIIPNPKYLSDPKRQKRAQRRKAILLRRMQSRSFEEL